MSIKIKIESDPINVSTLPSKKTESSLPRMTTFLLAGRPPKLLLVAIGSIGNAQLEKLIRTNLAMITEAFEAYRFIELGSETLVIHK